MPFSFNLPFFLCYPLTKLARKLRPARGGGGEYDQSAYFDNQYRDTKVRYAKHMGGVDLKGKTVLDIGGGLGGRSLGWLDLGAEKVINVDINRQELEAGRAILAATHPERAERVEFRHPDEMTGANRGDVAILFDCFEHFVDPGPVLKQVDAQLRPGGLVWIGSIGWYNYMASHCLGPIPIPWCQVFFSEMAIIKTIRKLLRSPGYKPYIWEQLEGLDRWDKVTTLRDRPGEPLNLLSLRKVNRLIRTSPFKLLDFKVYGFSGKVRRLSRVAAPLAKVPVLKEFFHSYYTALLVKPAVAVEDSRP